MHCNEISRNTLSYIVVSQKFKLKLISVTFLLPMISRNELSITLPDSTLWYDHDQRIATGMEELYRGKKNHLFCGAIRLLEYFFVY